MIVYIDNASTTKPCTAAIAAVSGALCENFGNPSSAHPMGQAAERIIKGARGEIASAIGAEPRNIVFTGSGTEANNLAIHTALKNPERMRGRRVITTGIEHSAVAEPLARLERLGVELIHLPCDGKGMADAEALAEILDCEASGGASGTSGAEGTSCGAGTSGASGSAQTALISVMHINNEIGTIQPIGRIAAIKSRHAERTGADILLHTDAIQSFCKLQIDVKSRFTQGAPQADGADSGAFHGVDLMSLSAHKMHGPKGVGALYAARPERIGALILGGGQEGGARSGTENVAGIAGFGAAAKYCGPVRAETVYSLRERMLAGIKDSIADIRVNSPEAASLTGEPGFCSPYILNVSFLGTRAEVILHDLEQHGIFVSTGSACSNIGKGAHKMSRTLAAIGLPEKEAAAALRFSFSADNTPEQIDYAVEHLKAAVERFRRMGSFRA
jgi:cysteine desulfurase